MVHIHVWMGLREETLKEKNIRLFGKVKFPKGKLKKLLIYNFDNFYRNL